MGVGELQNIWKGHGIVGPMRTNKMEENEPREEHTEKPLGNHEAGMLWSRDVESEQVWLGRGEAGKPQGKVLLYWFSREEFSVSFMSILTSFFGAF